MVNNGLINLNDPIEKYLPSNVSVSEFNGHKITVEDLAIHRSGLLEFPIIIAPLLIRPKLECKTHILDQTYLTALDYGV